jgi:hypothetical protein
VLLTCRKEDAGATAQSVQQNTPVPLQASEPLPTSQVSEHADMKVDPSLDPSAGSDRPQRSPTALQTSGSEPPTRDAFVSPDQLAEFSSPLHSTPTPPAPQASEPSPTLVVAEPPTATVSAPMIK